MALLSGVANGWRPSEPRPAFKSSAMKLLGLPSSSKFPSVRTGAQALLRSKSKDGSREEGPAANGKGTEKKKDTDVSILDKEPKSSFVPPPLPSIWERDARRNPPARNASKGLRLSPLGGETKEVDAQTSIPLDLFERMRLHGEEARQRGAHSLESTGRGRGAAKLVRPAPNHLHSYSSAQKRTGKVAGRG